MENRASGTCRAMIVAAIAAFAAWFALGCGPAAVARYSPAFAFVPPQQEQPTDISVALLKAKPIGQLQISMMRHGVGPVAVALPGGYQKPASAGHEQTFLSSLDNAFQQLLSARGLRLAGPYTSMDEMTFPQKKQTDMVFAVNADISFRKPYCQMISGFSGVYSECRGDCGFSGFISIEAWEPLSAQKIWMKRIDLPPTEMACTGRGEVADNSYARLLERAFAMTIDAASRFLITEEVALIRSQSKELREKKVY